MAGRIRLKVRLDLPPKELTPNCRCHFMAKANKTKKYRSAAMETAMVAASEAGMSDPMDRASVKATFYCRDSRARDADNALASLKAAFDGLADAGVVTNDRKLRFEPVEFCVDRDSPRVELVVKEMKEKGGE